MSNIVAKLTVEPGEYYLGDPCYSVPDELWMTWLENAKYDHSDADYVLDAEVDGRRVIAFSTASGDGIYPDQFNNLYPVDAGLIGLVPTSFNVNHKAKYPAWSDSALVQTVRFDSSTECWVEVQRLDGNFFVGYGDYTLVFGQYRIETGDIGLDHD